jgi:hypothetical protein
MNKKTLFGILALVILAVICAFFLKNYLATKNGNRSAINFATSTNNGSQSQTVTATQNPTVSSVTTSVPANVIVYKTKRDYTGLVWAYLSSDKKQVISFPDPKDILNQIPTKLNKGYFSGVLNMNTAIINIKIDSYAKMSVPLTAKQLFSLILNDSPFSEMYDCGAKGKIDTDHINTLIDTDKLASECDKVL